MNDSVKVLAKFRDAAGLMAISGKHLILLIYLGFHIIANFQVRKSKPTQII